ncbi:MAG: malate dehydrogenase [Bacteroidetes bacterium GWF2_29_10]|nr:MAG: malate dehydrogenase [Bacteroidetes bacterium GWF2_29_10]
MNYYDLSKLRLFVESVFTKMGIENEEAILATEVLIKAELRNIPSHGIIRLPDYVRLWQAGRINANPQIKIIKETHTTALIDADKAAGLVVGPKAMKLAIKKAQEYSSGWVCVNNSNHYGIAGYYAMMALEHNMIGISLTNANASVAPTFSVERLLGTNPIAIAIPTDKQPAFVLDMATSPVARGKLTVMEKKGERCPHGWIQDKDGNATDNPSIIRDGGSLVPLGSDNTHASYKGYGLAAVVDVLSGVLSGANYSKWVPPIVSYLPLLANAPGLGTGHFFGAMRIDAFRDAEEFKKEMDNFIQTFRDSKTSAESDAVLIPGDPERIAEEKFSKIGIPKIDAVDKELRELAEILHLDFSL